jgi:hypothetical protein
LDDFRPIFNTGDFPCEHREEAPRPASVGAANIERNVELALGMIDQGAQGNHRFAAKVAIVRDDRARKALLQVLDIFVPLVAEREGDKAVLGPSCKQVPSELSFNA